MDDKSELELFRTVTACREALREAICALDEAVARAMEIAGGDPDAVRLASEAELACRRARERTGGEPE